MSFIRINTVVYTGRSNLNQNKSLLIRHFVSKLSQKFVLRKCVSNLCYACMASWKLNVEVISKSKRHFNLVIGDFAMKALYYWC